MGINTNELVTGLKAKQNIEAITTPTGATSTVNISSPTIAETSVLTLHGATPVLNMPDPTAVLPGTIKRLRLVQDGTGSRVASWSSAAGAIQWTGKAAPTLTTAAGSIDQVVFQSDGVNWIEQSRNLNIG